MMFVDSGSFPLPGWFVRVEFESGDFVGNKMGRRRFTAEPSVVGDCRFVSMEYRVHVLQRRPWYMQKMGPQISKNGTVSHLHWLMFRTTSRQEGAV